MLALLPEEGRISYSAMTGQSLYYMGERDLAHKVLSVAEEEGAERAAYALKLLQSEGELRIASTGKDPHSGRLTTQEYLVRGPVAILLTTTATDVDEELLNRCLIPASTRTASRRGRSMSGSARRRRWPGCWRRGTASASCASTATRSGCCGRCTSSTPTPIC